MPQQKKTLGKNSKHPPSSQLSQFDASWRRWSFKNGLRCIYVPLPKGDHRLHISLMIHTGSRFEPVDKSGISHLLEHMMFRCSKNHPTFSGLSEAFEVLGGEWNAATGHEYTEFFYSGTADKCAAAFELLADFFLHPKLQDLETERKIVMRELEGELNENGESTDADFHALKTIWPHSSMAMPIVGTEASLLSITPQDLIKRINQYYCPENIVLCVVGNSLKEVKELSKKHFLKFPAERVFRKTTADYLQLPNYIGPKCVFVDNSDNEYDVQVSFVCEGTNSTLTPAYDMLSRILGDGFSSRLVKRIREELGLVYDISAGFHQYQGRGLFSIQASISEPHIETFFRELFGILNKISESGPTTEELTRHRTRALTDLQLVPSDPASIAFRLSWMILTSADLSLENWKAKLEDISQESLMNCAKTLFNPANRIVSVLGPSDGGAEKRFHLAQLF